MIIQLVIYSIMNIFQSIITELIDYVLCFGNEDDRTSFSKYYTAKLEDDEATMFFIIEKSEETTFAFLQNSVNII